MKLIKYSLGQIDMVAAQFLREIDGTQVITFTGGLGAGKTTFIRSLVAAMGVVEPVTSPTFTYFNIYHVPNEVSPRFTVASGQNGARVPVRLIYHFDLYRLKSLQDFELAGFFEYIYQPDSIALIEWPDILVDVLTHDVCHVELRVNAPEERLLMYGCK